VHALITEDFLGTNSFARTPYTRSSENPVEAKFARIGLPRTSVDKGRRA
jgi:hypothetical protein